MFGFSNFSVHASIVGLVGGAILAVVSFYPSPVGADGEFGAFDKSPIVKLLSPPPDIELQEELSFKTATGELWVAPKSYVSDGASIPRFFWTPVGGPLSGAYRDAAIIHDYYCEHFDRYWPEDYKRDWKAVHRAFYYGMRARGVGEKQAKLMFAAVYHFGPRWEWKDKLVRRIGVERILGGDINPEDEVYDYVDRNLPSLEAIENYEPSGRPVANYSPQQWHNASQ